MAAKLLRAAETIPAPRKLWRSHDQIARAFDEATAHGQRTWQSGGKRALHQLQIESIGAAIVEMQRATPDAVGVELGGGKALLGRCVASVGCLPVTVVERRDVSRVNYDECGVCDSDTVARVHSDLEEVKLQQLTRGAPAIVFAKHLVRRPQIERATFTSLARAYPELKVSRSIRDRPSAPVPRARRCGWWRRPSAMRRAASLAAPSLRAATHS